MTAREFLKIYDDFYDFYELGEKIRFHELNVFSDKTIA